MRSWRPWGSTDCLPTTVMPVLSRDGSSLFGVSKSGPSPTIAPWPTTTSLSRMERSTTAPDRMTESNITIESPHEGDTDLAPEVDRPAEVV